jgi:hypothetical protein
MGGCGWERRMISLRKEEDRRWQRRWLTEEAEAAAEAGERKMEWEEYGQW